MTLLLYVQSVAQLQELYGREGTRAILANCDHQLWYPAAEIETARFMSEMYGTTLKASPVQLASQGARRQRGQDGYSQMQTSSNQGASWSWREEAALSPNEMMALPPGQVLTVMKADRRYVFLGRWLDSRPLFATLPGPAVLRLPEPRYRPRQYTDWSALTVTPPAPPARDDAAAGSVRPVPRATAAGPGDDTSQDAAAGDGSSRPADPEPGGEAESRPADQGSAEPSSEPSPGSKPDRPGRDMVGGRGV